METTTDSDPRALGGDDANLPIPCLTIVDAPSDEVVGARRTITPGRPLLLGRTSTASFPGVFRNSSVSREHCRIGYAPSRRITVTDLGSRNGTYVNNARVEGSQPLEPGDVIAVGDVLGVFHEVPRRLTVSHHPRLKGVSNAIASVLEDVRLVAGRKTSVLLVGSTGTGKEVVAREIHRNSRRQGAMVSLNCAGVSDSLLSSELFGHVRGAFTGAERDRKGLLEAARGGTLFLDELTDASSTFQASLLRLLETNEYRRVGSDRVERCDVRFVAAVQPRIYDLLEDGRFRLDLWTRLAQWVVTLPPLGERIEDIPILARSFARDFVSGPLEFERELIVALMRHRWPGNVRELRASMERLVVSSEGDTTLRYATWRRLNPLSEGESQPPAAPASLTKAVSPTQGPPKRQVLEELLTANAGNVKASAAQLGCTRKTLYRWLRERGLDAKQFRP